MVGNKSTLDIFLSFEKCLDSENPESLSSRLLSYCDSCNKRVKSLADVQLYKCLLRRIRPGGKFTNKVGTGP